MQNKNLIILRSVFFLILTDINLKKYINISKQQLNKMKIWIKDERGF